MIGAQLDMLANEARETIFNITSPDELGNEELMAS